MHRIVLHCMVYDSPFSLRFPSSFPQSSCLGLLRVENCDEFVKDRLGIIMVHLMAITMPYLTFLAYTTINLDEDYLFCCTDLAILSANITV